MEKLNSAWFYWRKNIETAKGGFDMAALIIAGGMSWSSVLCDLVNLPNPIESAVTVAGFSKVCEIIGITIFCAWCFLWLPFRRHEAEQKKFEGEKLSLKNEHDSEKNSLQLEIKKIAAELAVVKEQTLPLEIESIICEKTVGFKSACRVKIANQSLATPARNLKVELVKIEPMPKWKEAPSVELPLTFPFRLHPKEKDGNTINPKDGSLFELLTVTDGSWNWELEFATDAMWKAFEHSLFEAEFSESKPVSEYLLTIAASADYRPRIEQSFKMIISSNPEHELSFKRA